MIVQRFIKTCKFIDPLKKFKFSDLTCLPKNAKVCIFMHGTSGFSKNCINYMKLLHKLGFYIVAPDHNVYHHYLCNIYRKHIFCGRHLHFNTNAHFAKVNKSLYRYVAHFRKQELETIYRYINAKYCIALGVSEGAIAVSLAKIPCTKFICSYSIEKNYFTQKYPVIYLKKNQKIVQIIGTNDEYFGKHNSISSKLYKNINGHGLFTFKKNGHKNFHIYLLKGQKHCLLAQGAINKNLIYSIIYSHLGARQKRISPKFATLYFKING